MFCRGRSVVASPKPDFQLVNLKLASEVSSYMKDTWRVVLEFRVDGSTSKGSWENVNSIRAQYIMYINGLINWAKL